MGYSYASGRQTGITYPSGRAVAYGFDAQGHVTSITVDGTTSVLANGEYFPFGPVKKWVWGNGEPYQRSFDLDGRVKTITLGPAAGTYADLGEVFGYDSLNRLITANLAAGQTQGFAYDANGNRTNATINAASTTYTYPSTSHKLTSLSGATSRSFTYDNAGNVTVSAGITYTYDGRGRMKQAATTTYALNGLGQRVKKNNGADVFFAYDEAGHLIGEYDATGAPIEETVWLGDLPVAVLKPNTGGFDVFYVWADHLGTPRQITDMLNQSRWEWPNADPFGNNAPNENPAGLGTFTYNLRFPGQYYDSEKGSNYNYFRDYDPGIGRYVESDPIGLQGGLNVYAYVADDPLGFFDPEGLDSQGLQNPPFRYNQPPPGTVPLTPDMVDRVKCIARCLGTCDKGIDWHPLYLVVTGGSEARGHARTSLHPKSLAVDFSAARNPELFQKDQDNVVRCAKSCGFTHGWIEPKPKHYHFQIGAGAGVPPLPTPRAR